MKLNPTAPPEEFEQQVSNLLSGLNIDDPDKEVIIKFSVEGQAKWKGALKGREDNLARAIKASILDLQIKGLLLSNDYIIANLWTIDVGVDDDQAIIQEIIEKPDNSNSYVAWIDQRGRERITKFGALKQRIKDLNKKLQFR